MAGPRFRYHRRPTFRPAQGIAETLRTTGRTLYERYGAMLAPYFKVEISGQDEQTFFSADAQVYDMGYDLNGMIVQDASYAEDIDGASEITLTINNPDLNLQDSRMFAEGNNIDVFMGYDNHPPFYMGRGIITQIEPDFPVDGMPSIKVTAYDISYFMMEDSRADVSPEHSRWWEANTRRETIYHWSNALEAAVSREEYLTPTYGVVPDNDARLARQAYLDDMNDLGPDETSSEFDHYNEPINPDDPINQQPATPRGPEDVQASEGWLDPGKREEGYNTEIWQEPDVWRDQDPEDTSYHTPIYSSRGLEESEEEPTDETGTAIPGALGGFLAGRRGDMRPTTRIRTEWQRARFGNRRRNAGCVWSEMTDSDIVAAIFLSYGVIPYEEATREARSTRVIQATSSRREMRTVNDAHTSELSDEDYADRERVNAYMEEQGSEFRQPLTTTEEAIDAGEDLSPASGEIEEEQVPFQAEAPTVTPEQTTRARTVVQKAGTTDWEFIQQLAQQHGYICFVFFHYQSRRWIGYWGPQSNVPQSDQYIFRYARNEESTLSMVRPSVNMRGQSTEIDLIYVDPRNRRENRLRVTMDNVSRYSPEFRGPDGPQPLQEAVGRGPEVTLMIHGQRVRVHANRRFSSAEDARQWLMAYWVQHAADFVLVEGETIIGLPEMRARQNHRIEGIGRYAGEYFITTARHTMGPGKKYSTEFGGRIVNQWEDPARIENKLLTVDTQTIGERVACVMPHPAEIIEELLSRE